MLTESEAELLRLWRSTDDHGRRHVMDVARLEAEATAEARGDRLARAGGRMRS